MEFFNRKEEVLDVELTQYGKYLLSVGKFKPSFYAFFDDDIIYDTQYQGAPPNADGTSVPLIYRGPQELSKGINFKYVSRFKNDYYGVSLPLGTSDLNSEYAPSWQINFMQSKLKSSSAHLGGDGDEKYGIKKIPQLEIQVTFETSVGSNAHSDISKNVVSEATPGSKLAGTNNEIFANGNFVKIEEDYILLDIQELNGIFGTDNFEIEVFEEILPIGVVKEKKYLRQLNFLTEESPLLYESVDDIEFQDGQASSNLSTGMVDYYFEVSVDDEIQEISGYENTQANTAMNELEPCEDDV